MLRRCASIVRVLRTSCSAISRLVRPAATRPAISRLAARRAVRRRLRRGPGGARGDRGGGARATASSGAGSRRSACRPSARAGAPPMAAGRSPAAARARPSTSDARASSNGAPSDDSRAARAVRPPPRGRSCASSISARSTQRLLSPTAYRRAWPPPRRPPPPSRRRRGRRTQAAPQPTPPRPPGAARGGRRQLVAAERPRQLHRSRAPALPAATSAAPEAPPGCAAVWKPGGASILRRRARVTQRAGDVPGSEAGGRERAVRPHQHAAGCPPAGRARGPRRRSCHRVGETAELDQRRHGLEGELAAAR